MLRDAAIDMSEPATLCRGGRQTGHRPSHQIAKLVTVALAVVLTACSTVTPPSTPHVASATNLTTPGVAQNAISQLVSTAGTPAAIKVTIDETTASMTYIANDQAVTLGWDAGVVAPMDSDVTYVGQASFAVADFNLQDIGAMFGQAAALTGSNEHQQLQINEYNNGKVLMTVTTSPESQTIFFRADASLVNWLAFTTVSGVATGLADVDTDGTPVVAIGINDQGLYADALVGTSIIERHTRPTKLPTYSAQRSGTVNYPAFSPTALTPQVIAGLLSNSPTVFGKPSAHASLVIDSRDNIGTPVIRVTVGLTTRAYSLDGQDITDQLP